MHLKARFDTGGGDVGVLPARARGAACADRNLGQRDYQVSGDPQATMGAFLSFVQDYSLPPSHYATRV